MDCQTKKDEDDLNFDRNSERNKFLFFDIFCKSRMTVPKTKFVSKLMKWKKDKGASEVLYRSTLASALSFCS